MVGESNLTREWTSVELGAVKNRIRGSIFASACGNALAGCAIGLTRKEAMVLSGSAILHDYLPGLSTSQHPNHIAGKPLSDVHAGIALASSLIETGGRFKQDNFKRHLQTLLSDEEFIACHPGAMCLTNMRAAIEKREPLAPDLQIADTTVTFRAFVAGCLPGEPKTDEPLSVAKEQCLPHPSDKRVQAAAAVIADSVAFFARGHRLDTESEVREYVRRELDLANAIDDRFADAWDGIAPDLDYTKPALDLPYSVINVQTDVTELVPTAVGIFLIFRHSLEDAVGIAALAGGKTDSVAAIVGALSGAYHGASVIPEKWINGISNRPILEQISSGLGGLWN